eukprot:231776-Prorocentrum_minimum.AAC.1
MGRGHSPCAHSPQLQASTLRIVPPAGCAVSLFPNTQDPDRPQGRAAEARGDPPTCGSTMDDDSLPSPDSSKDDNSWSHSEGHLRDMQAVLMTLRAGIDIMGRVTMPALGGQMPPPQ